MEEEPVVATPVSDLKQEKKKTKLKKLKSKKLKLKSGGMTWPIICSKCKTVMTNVNDFNKHMLEHWTADKCCAICNKSNPNRGNFMTHIRRHSGERPFQCPACQMSFNQKPHLIKHMAKVCKNQDQKTTMVATSSDEKNAQKRLKKMNLKKSDKKKLKKKNEKK